MNSSPKSPVPPASNRLADTSFLLLVLVLPWTIAPMGIAAGLCAAVTLTLALARRGVRWRRTPVDLPALGWALALLLAALFALDRAASLGRLGKMLFPGLVGLAAAHASDVRVGRRAVWTLLGSAALAALFGLAVFAARGAGFEARARGAVGHYMTFAGQLLLFLAVALGVALGERRPGTRVAALAAAAPLLAALAATFTRSAWLGLLAALATMLAWWRPRWLPALAVLAALVVALAPGVYRARLVSVFDPASPWNRERTYMWEAGARMFRDHPLTGVGLMDLHPVYERYRPPGAAEAAGHLHSVPVQIAATMGVAGLIAFAALYGSLLWLAARGLRAELRRQAPGAGLRLGVLAALAGFFVAGLFEWNFGDEELLYPLYTLAGLAWAARGWRADGAAAASDGHGGGADAGGRAGGAAPGAAVRR